MAVARVLQYLGYDPLNDFEASSHLGIITIDWRHTDPQPTPAEIAAAEASAGYLIWRDENGGDPVKTLRKQAEDELSASRKEAAVLRSFMLLVVDELNAHTDRTNAILAAAATATSLASFKSSMALILDLPTRTGGQLRTAIVNKIRAGDADI